MSVVTHVRPTVRARWPSYNASVASAIVDVSADFFTVTHMPIGLVSHSESYDICGAADEIGSYHHSHALAESQNPHPSPLWLFPGRAQCYPAVGSSCRTTDVRTHNGSDAALSASPIARDSQLAAMQGCDSNAAPLYALHLKQSWVPAISTEL